MQCFRSIDVLLEFRKPQKYVSNVPIDFSSQRLYCIKAKNPSNKMLPPVRIVLETSGILV